MTLNHWHTQNLFIKGTLLASTICIPFVFASCGQRGPQGEPGIPGNSFFPPTLDVAICASSGGPATFSGSCFTNGQPLLLECIVLDGNSYENYTNNATCVSGTWNISFSSTDTPLDTEPIILCDILDEEHGLISPFSPLSCE